MNKVHRPLKRGEKSRLRVVYHNTRYGYSLVVPQDNTGTMLEGDLANGL